MRASAKFLGAAAASFFRDEEESAAVESAVGEVLASKVRTPDIAEPGIAAVSASEMGECVLSTGRWSVGPTVLITAKL